MLRSVFLAADMAEALSTLAVAALHPPLRCAPWLAAEPDELCPPRKRAECGSAAAADTDLAPTEEPPTPKTEPLPTAIPTPEVTPIPTITSPYIEGITDQRHKVAR